MSDTAPVTFTLAGILTLQSYRVRVAGRRIHIEDLASLTKLASPDNLIDDPLA